MPKQKAKKLDKKDQLLVHELTEIIIKTIERFQARKKLKRLRYNFTIEEVK